MIQNKSAIIKEDKKDNFPFGIPTSEIPMLINETTISNRITSIPMIAEITSIIDLIESRNLPKPLMALAVSSRVELNPENIVNSYSGI
ncbi:MAG: hypothetical protein V1874_05980 [Spirochaetota bacterium]